MIKRWKAVLWFIVGVLFMAAGIRAVQVRAVGADVKGRVLFISSYSYAWDAVQIQIEGIKAGIGPEVVLD